MKIQISKATEISNKALEELGYSQEESRYITELLLDAELAGKPSHGFMRLIAIQKMIKDGRVEVNKHKIEITKETNQSILVDGKKKTGLYVVPKALDISINKIKDNKVYLYCCGVFNTSPTAGMIGYYARKATENNLIYIGFHNSMSYLIPFGAKKSLFGTNPITIGVPTNDLPIIWDCSSSKTSVGSIILKKNEGKNISENIALDKDGNPTINPLEALAGGILPFSEHKGSGMAMMVELIAGALVGSSIRKDKQWNWGSFFILINPSALRDIDEFKKDVDETIKELKNLPKTAGVSEIYYPGEKSQATRRNQIKKGSFELSDKLYQSLIKI